MEGAPQIVGVQASDEFYRVAALPRRDWLEEIQRDELRDRMSSFYRTPWGKQRLHLIQAATLAELHDLRGVVAPIPAGDGKTLISFLAPMVVGAERPLLLVPAGLREKTIRDFKLLSQHWLGPRGITIENYRDYNPYEARFKGTVIESYEMLSQKDGQQILDLYKPDLIIADEAQKLKNLEAACTKKFVRFMRANTSTMFAPLSGTMMVRSMKNFWHLMLFALRHHMPLPRLHAELERWCAAIDEKKDFSPTRPHAGVLFEFATEEDKEKLRQLVASARGNITVLNSPDAIAIARKSMQNRLKSAPGVILTEGTTVQASLRITRLPWSPNEKCQAYLKQVRETSETPNGDILLDGVAVWKQCRELSCGFFYRWEPAAPEEWLKRRKKWFKKARTILGMGLTNIDSLGQVEEAVARGRLNYTGVHEAFAEWREIMHTFEINVVAEWVDDTILNHTLAWMKKHPRSIVWTEHRAFGFKLSELSGVGFCANGGLDQRGVFIDDYQGRQVIASVESNHEGRNLQAWHRSLVVSMLPNGGMWEQLLARTHRPFQPEDTVFYDWVASCSEQIDGFQNALRDAACAQDTLGQKQRLLYADHVEEGS